MNVLSLFDGISCGRVALERAGIKVDKYFASEIDKDAIKVAMKNYPDIIQLGDVTRIKATELPKIDLLIGGSPCQSISNLGNKEGLNGKSGLFYEYIRILNQTGPKYFLLENVLGNKESIEIITKKLGVNPIKINSNLVSAQNRNRLYWTNIKSKTLTGLFDYNIKLPQDKNIYLSDILESGIPKNSILTRARMKWLKGYSGQKCISKRYANIDPQKAGCLTARSDASWNSNYVTREGQLTRLTPIEYERLQTLPDNYTECISNKKRYETIGNGWTVDVIVHILKNIKE